MTSRQKTLALVLGVVVVAAAALAAVLVAVGSGGGGTTTTTAAAERSSVLTGIPQSGNVLGDPGAPALVEFADLQCPYCGEVANRVLPVVIRDYVRTGRVKLVFDGLAFVGADSQTALRAVEAAGLQNRLWDVVEALYARQGAENSGWVTQDLLEQVGAGVPGLDVKRWLADAKSSSAVDARIARAAAAANQAGVRGTPTFLFAGRQLQLRSLDPADFSAALDPLLGT